MEKRHGGFRPGAGRKVDPNLVKVVSKQIRIKQSVLDRVEAECERLSGLGQTISARQWIEQVITDRLQTKEAE